MEILKRQDMTTPQGRLLTGTLCVIILLLLFSLAATSAITFKGSAASQSKGLIALTFDDGPSPEYTPAVLDILQAYNATATFFVLGKSAEAHPELVARMVREGHEVGVHGYSHELLVLRSGAVLRKEINDVKALIEAYTGKGVRFYRPAYGILGPGELRVARKNSLRVIGGSLNGKDYVYASGQEISSRILAQARPGDIILFHDAGGRTRQPTLDSLPEIITGLRRNGYTLARLDEMLDS